MILTLKNDCSPGPRLFVIYLLMVKTLVSFIFISEIMMFGCIGFCFFMSICIALSTSDTQPAVIAANNAAVEMTGKNSIKSTSSSWIESIKRTIQVYLHFNQFLPGNP